VGISTHFRRLARDTAAWPARQCSKPLKLVEQHYPAFRELRAETVRPLPGYVQEEFEAYLKCGRLEEGFLRVRCEQCHAEKLVAFSCKKRGYCASRGARRLTEAVDN